MDDSTLAWLAAGLVTIGLVCLTAYLARSLKRARAALAAQQPRKRSKGTTKTSSKKASSTPAPSLRSTPPPAPKQTETAKAESVRPAAMAELPKGADAEVAATHGEADLTRMTPFAKAQQALPKLSLDDESEDDERLGSESRAVVRYENDAWMGKDEVTGSCDLILTSASAQSDRGIIRRRNEDSFVIDPKVQLYVVADGMGGYAGGEVASRLAVEQIRASVRAPGELVGNEDRPRRGRELIAAVERANAMIYEKARQNPELHGMGTTVLAARFSPGKQRMYLAHVGDSRCYRLRDGVLQVMTKDHTLASRGLDGPMAGNLCRAVGVEANVKVDLLVDKPLPNDLYLLCSDGLSKMVPEEQIRKILADEAGLLLEETDRLRRIVASLVLAANAGGGRDNITVILVGIQEITKSKGRVSTSGAGSSHAHHPS